MSDELIKWLLEDENPAIKYRTMTEICENGEMEEVKMIYDSIWGQKEMIKMLNKQAATGSDKYLTAFAELGLRKDERIDRFVDHTIAFLSKDCGGCAGALVLRALVMLGYHDRCDVKRLLDIYTLSQLHDGGFICKRLLDKKPERKSCYKAAVASLLLYAECKRKNILPENSSNLINYFLKRDVFYSSDKSTMLCNDRPGWRYIDNFFPAEPMRIGLPLIVSALSVLGAGDEPALAKAWELLKEKQDTDGKLYLEGTLTKQPYSFGKVGQVNKWVTFYALLAWKYKKLKGASIRPSFPV